MKPPSLPPQSPPDMARYDRRPLLSDYDFLRRLPLVTEPELKMSLEALALIADALTWAHATMVGAATAIAVRTDEMTIGERAQVFAAVWSIVDGLDAARMLMMKVSPTPDSETRDLLDRLQPVRAIRNGRDHLGPKMPGLAAVKGWRGPVFGNLSFFYVPPTDIMVGPNGPKVVGGVSIVVQGGPARPMEFGKLVRPDGRLVLPPVDLFTLSAFDLEVPLDPLVGRFGIWLANLSQRTEEALRRHIEAAASATGKAVDELLQHAPDVLVARATMRFGDHPDFPAHLKPSASSGEMGE